MFRDLLAGMLLGMIVILAVFKGLGVLEVDRRPLIIRPIRDYRPTATPTPTPCVELTPEEERDMWRELLDMLPLETKCFSE